MRLVVMLLVLVMGVQGFEWSRNFSTAQLQAHQEQKLLIVIVSSTQCPWCRKLKYQTLQDPNVRARLERSFVGVDALRGHALYPPKLDIAVVPMSYFLTPKGEIIEAVGGYYDPKGYIELLERVVRESKEF